MGAGQVNQTLLANVRGMARALGPVAGVSYRVASRIANSLGAGTAVRSPDELDEVKTILFCSSEDQFDALSQALLSAKIQWRGKTLLFVDCERPQAMADHFCFLGTSTGCVRRSPFPGRLVVEGSGAALNLANRMVASLGMKPIGLTEETAAAYEAALTLASGALTPLIDQAAGLLKQCDVRDSDATRLAASLFEITARDYGRIGRQSWVWYQHKADAARILPQLRAVGAKLRALLGELIMFGLEDAGDQQETLKAVRAELDKTR